ncbi:MAG: AmpG family muropeptide MFS transporter [Bacteroidales bacterium]|nr:AmpG family muropeptide MFS transporter [Bacteroidales bacterium]
MNEFAKTKGKNAWSWIPTLYFAQGLPYVAVMTIAVIMYKRLGLSNTDIALYTSWLYLPWVIKPLWSPFVDLVKTKRLWVILMQSTIAVGFAGVAFFLPTTFFIKSTLAFFWLIAFSSATHDIAADGFYMLALTQGEQSFFVGIRNTFYRFATIFGQGVLVMLAGLLEEGKIIPKAGGNIPLAWSLSFYLLAAIFLILTLYHRAILPRPATDVSRDNITPLGLLKDFFNTFGSFFKKNNLALALFFILTYRLGESQLVKIATPFLLDSAEAGGLGLPTATVGMVYGTIGVIALLLGGVIGGIAVSRGGLKKWIIPMALAINLPDLLYVYMASALPEKVHVIAFYIGSGSSALFLTLDKLYVIIFSVAMEQLGYGFGFTAFMLYLIYVAEGMHKTSHYAIGTGFMALGMMLPGMAAGAIQEAMGYERFFWFVCLCTLPGILASVLVKKKLPAEYGKK